MRGRLALAAMTAALVGIGVPAANAATVKIPGKVVVDSLAEFSPPPGPGLDSVVYGHVESKPACLTNRKVVLKGGYSTESGFRPYDVGITGKNGGFSGIGPLTHGSNDLVTLKAIMKPKDIGTKRHPKTCKGDTFMVVE
jgi:hypothetical protein